MERKIIFGLIVLVVVGWLFIFFIQKISQFIEPAGRNTVEVVYSRSNTIPAWPPIVVTFRDDGTITYENVVSNTTDIWDIEKEVKRGKLSRKETRKFKNLVLRANVFEMEDEYTCEPGPCPYDLESEGFTFTINGRTKSIYIYVPKKLPKELVKIKERMREFQDRLE